MKYRTRYIPQWKCWVAERKVLFFLWVDLYEFITYCSEENAVKAIKTYAKDLNHVKTSDSQIKYYEF
jgi:hypothetical protein